MFILTSFLSSTSMAPIVITSLDSCQVKKRTRYGLVAQYNEIIANQMCFKVDRIGYLHVCTSLRLNSSSSNKNFCRSTQIRVTLTYA